MFYLLLILAVGILCCIGWRAVHAPAARPKTRVIGPDDDPEFLWRISHGDNNPKS